LPIYEYACPRCRRIFSFLARSTSRRPPVKCPRCGGKLRKLVSTFGIGRSEESRLAGMADPSFFSGLDERDPGSLARLMRKMAGESGEPLDEEMEEACRRLEAGEDPGSVDDPPGSDGWSRDPSLYE